MICLCGLIWRMLLWLCLLNDIVDVLQVGALQDVRSELTKLRGVIFYKILEDLHAHLYNKGEYRYPLSLSLSIYISPPLSLLIFESLIPYVFLYPRFLSIYLFVNGEKGDFYWRERGRMFRAGCWIYIPCCFHILFSEAFCDSLKKAISNLRKLCGWFFLRGCLVTVCVLKDKEYKENSENTFSFLCYFILKNTFSKEKTVLEIKTWCFMGGFQNLFSKIVFKNRNQTYP